MSWYIRRPSAAWNLAVRLGESLTTPRLDPARENDVVSQLAADSLFGRAARLTAAATVLSWRTARLRHVVMVVTAGIASADEVERTRLVGVMVLVASVVALLARLAQAWPGRFTWALPSLAALIALLLIARPRAIARALEDRRR